MVFCRWRRVNHVVAGVLMHSERMCDDVGGGCGGGGDGMVCAQSSGWMCFFFLRSCRFASVATASIQTWHNVPMSCMQHDNLVFLVSFAAWHDTSQ